MDYTGLCCVCGSKELRLSSKTSDGRRVCSDCVRKTRVLYDRWSYDADDKYVKNTTSSVLHDKLRLVKTVFNGSGDIYADFPGKDCFFYYDIAENRIGGGPWTGGFRPDQIEVIFAMGKAYKIIKDIQPDGVRTRIQEIPISISRIPGYPSGGIDIDVWVSLPDKRRANIPFIRKSAVCSFEGRDLYRGVWLYNLTDQMFGFYRDFFLFLIEEGDDIMNGKVAFPDI